MKADRFIALELDTDCIRMAVVERNTAGPPIFIDSGSVVLEPDHQHPMAQEAVVATALKRLLDEKKPSTRRAIISIDGQSVFSRIVKLPPVAPDKRVRTIRHEAVQNIPFPIDDVVWDAHVFDPDVSEPEVLLVAVKAELVNGLVHAVTANGLSVERIAVAPVELANALRSGIDASESVLLIDAGKLVTNLIFVDGVRTFFRTLPIAGSQELRLMQEVERSIRFYVGQQGGKAPVRILVSGAKSIDPVKCSERLGLSVEGFDPLQHIEGVVGQLEKGTAGVVVGLAGAQLLSINLVPEALEKERGFLQRQPYWLASAVVLLLIAGVWAFALNRMVAQTRSESARVAARVQTLEKIEQQLIPVEREIDALNREANGYRGASRRRTFWQETLQEISRCLPDGMFLLSSEPIKDGETLGGLRVAVVSYLDKEAEGVDAVKLLRNTLRESKRFSDECNILSRPSKKAFARQFVLDLYFEEEQP